MLAIGEEVGGVGGIGSGCIGAYLCIPCCSERYGWGCGFVSGIGLWLCVRVAYDSWNCCGHMCYLFWIIAAGGDWVCDPDRQIEVVDGLLA